MIAIVLFGKPGAGKGTQAEFLKEKYNLTHISTGDIFRFNIKNETELGKKAQEYIHQGQLVPDEITIDMLKSEVQQNMDKSGFLFDGFPRTIAQAEALDAFMKSIGWKLRQRLLWKQTIMYWWLVFWNVEKLREEQTIKMKPKSVQDMWSTTKKQLH